jgi:hypothetical protein
MARLAGCGLCVRPPTCLGLAARRSELFSYEECIFYTIVTSLISLDRVELKAKVVDAPEVLSVIESIPNAAKFLNSLYYVKYREFFQVCEPAWGYSPLVLWPF